MKHINIGPSVHSSIYIIYDIKTWKKTQCDIKHGFLEM